jgi:hypothetical protein
VDAWGRRPLEAFIVRNDVEPLVEEGDEAADLCGAEQWLLARPGDVGNDAVIGYG